MLVAEVSVPLVAVKVYPVPARSILSPLKVAMPLTAVTVFVPERTAPLVPVPDVMARVTGAVELVTVLPLAS